jgi:hypothetical protein
MNLRGYINLDKKYKKSLNYYYTKNLGIGAVGMFLFCTFVIAAGLRLMDHIVVFNIYLICFLIATSLYFWPLVQVRENIFVVSIFKKFRNAPINKKLFIRAKLILLNRFAVLFYVPVQVMHIIGLKRTETPHLSLVAFWPMSSMIFSIVFQYIYMRFRARDF